MIELVRAGTPAVVPAARLFDHYRVHYGWPAAAGNAAVWLGQQLGLGRLMAWTVSVDGALAGIVTVAPMPASLALGTAWLVRDLFVAPDFRRRGLARALLEHVINEASAAGAIRVSLQTEVDNAPALALYRSLGFEHVGGLRLLSLTLRP